MTQRLLCLVFAAAFVLAACDKEKKNDPTPATQPVVGKPSGEKPPTPPTGEKPATPVQGPVTVKPQPLPITLPPRASSTKECVVRWHDDSVNGKGHFIMKNGHQITDSLASVEAVLLVIDDLQKEGVCQKTSTVECSARYCEKEGYYVAQNGAMVTDGLVTLEGNLDVFKELVKHGVCMPSKTECDLHVDKTNHTILQGNEAVTASIDSFRANLDRLKALKDAGACKK